MIIGDDRADTISLLQLLALGAIGAVAVASATLAESGAVLSGSGLKQAFFVLAGVVVYKITERIDVREWANSSLLLYLVGVVVLAALPFFARPIGGARSWIDLGPISIQPSEPMKAVVALACAAYLGRSEGKLSFWRLVVLGVLVAVPVVLIAMQPDLGTAITFVPMFLALAWVAGIRPRVLVALALVGALLLPVMWFGVLKDYQKERIITVFDPSRDPSGSGYQVIQSRIAVGSGGVFGKGLFRGSQSRLDFLPARETDFVLAVVAEEAGFVGVVIVFALWGSLIFRAFSTARIARDRVGNFFCVAVGALWSGQIFINAGMVTGILPTIGVPLPVISYGGSSIVATFLAFGLVASVRRGRYVNV